MTHQQIANLLGFSKQYIQQIEKRALDKLKKKVTLKRLLEANRPEYTIWYEGCYRHGRATEGHK